MIEIHMNTADQVRGYLRAALEIVEELDPPEDLRQIAFAKAVDQVANKNVTLEPGDVSSIARPLMTIPKGL